MTNKSKEQQYIDHNDSHSLDYENGQYQRMRMSDRKNVTPPPNRPELSTFLAIIGVLIMIVGGSMAWMNEDPTWGIIILLCGATLCVLQYVRLQKYNKKRDEWKYSLPDHVLIAQMGADATTDSAKQGKYGMWAIAGGLAASKFF